MIRCGMWAEVRPNAALRDRWRFKWVCAAQARPETLNFEWRLKNRSRSLPWHPRLSHHPRVSLLLSHINPQSRWLRVIQRRIMIKTGVFDLLYFLWNATNQQELLCENVIVVSCGSYSAFLFCRVVVCGYHLSARLVVSNVASQLEGGGRCQYRVQNPKSEAQNPEPVTRTRENGDGFSNW